MVSKLLFSNEKAKTFRLFESYSFDQSKLVIIQVLIENLHRENKQISSQRDTTFAFRPRRVTWRLETANCVSENRSIRRIELFPVFSRLISRLSDFWN